MHLEKQRQLSISLLCVICDRDRRKKVEEILGKHEVFFSLFAYGKGTANSRILGYLGLGETEKAVFFTVLASSAVQQITQSLDTALQMSKPGNGISFAIKVRTGCYHTPVHFIDDECGGIAMRQDSTHDLIMVVLNRGYSEEVMEVARGSGATGGTILHARGCGAAGMEKFFGMTVTPEKEMMMILTQSDHADAIMESIAAKAGPDTDAGAVSFSLPASGVKGIADKAV